MSKAKKLIRKYLDGIEVGQRPAVARRTVFTRQADGAVLRRIVRTDGTVEHRERITEQTASRQRYSDIE